MGSPSLVEKSSQTLKRATKAFNYSTQRGYGGPGGYGPSNGGFVGGYGGAGYGYGGDPLGQLGNGVASQQFQHQAYQPAGTASSFQGRRPGQHGCHVPPHSFSPVGSCLRIWRTSTGASCSRSLRSTQPRLPNLELRE